MNKEILFYKPPKWAFFIELFMAILFGLIAYIIFISFIKISILSLKTIPFLVLFIGLSSFIYLLFFSYSFAVFNNRIEVYYPLKNKKSFIIRLNRMQSIALIQNRGAAFEVLWKNDLSFKKMVFPLYGDTFKFAKALKYFKEHGIPIYFEPKDDEVELYVNGRINKLPMTNDMVIKKR